MQNCDFGCFKLIHKKEREERIDPTLKDPKL